MLALRKPWKPVAVVLALVVAGAGCTTVVRSSSAPNGAGANGPVHQFIGPSISDNGRFVAFTSTAGNLVPGIPGGSDRAYWHDNATGQTTLASARDDGTPATGSAFAVSGTGLHVAFATDEALEPADTNGVRDVYVRTVDAGTTERVSIRPDGSPIFHDGPIALRRVTLSDDGRYALLDTSEPGFGRSYLRDLTANTTTLLSEGAAAAILSGNGQWMVRNDLCTGGPCPFQSKLVSTDLATIEAIAPDCGFEAHDVSADARYVVGRRFGVYPTFQCPDTAGIVRWDRTNGQLRPVGVDTVTGRASISNNGRFVSVLDDDERLHVVDLQTGAAQVADSDFLGRRGTEPTTHPALSGSGRYVVFNTTAALDPDDGNGLSDAFTRYSLSPEITDAAPATVARGASHVTVRINGSEFLPGATVAFPNGGVTAHDITLVNPSRLDVELSVANDAPTGPAPVVVTNTGGFGASHALCATCLTIS